MRKNEIYEAEITGITAEGEGICRVEGMAVFVPQTAVGDRLRVRIVKVNARYAYGIMEALLSPGEGRCEPDCPVFRQCGGCTLRHVSRETQLKYKSDLVEDAFRRIGHVPETVVFEPILGDAADDRYRNKAQYPITVQNGHLMCGFYARHSHRIIPQTDCLLQPELFSEILQFLLPALERSGVTAYEEAAHTGELRHVYLRRMHYTGEVMLCFVVRKSIRKKVTPLLPELMQRFPVLVSILESVNPARTNVILGEHARLLAGKETVKDVMCGLKIEISPFSFYQVNTPQAERLYATAKEFAGLSEGRRVRCLLDMYCGAGTIGLSMADAAEKLIGVEVVPEAVENARKNAAENHIENAEFICGDAGNVAEMLAEREETPDVILLDPPRKGCDSKTIQAVRAMHPERVVMISCNPATAARDAERFAEAGYDVERVRAVDMFPGTGHVECVVLMSKVKEK